MATTFNNYTDVQDGLDAFVSQSGVNIGGSPHGAFWQTMSYTDFITGDIPGNVPDGPWPILVVRQSANSNIIQILQGTGNAAQQFGQMPRPRPPYDPEQSELISALAAWIDDGANLLSYTFDGNSGGVPNNWTQILDPGGSIVETNDLTITATTGNPTGIASGKTTYDPDDPEGVVSTIVVVINGISADGNAIFGLIGLDGQGNLKGELGAGIDASGNVFAVALSPGGPSGNPVPFPNPKFSGYSGGETTLTLVINSDRVRVTSGQVYDSGDLLFSGLGNFSLSTAFGNVAIPALVGASQPNQKGGQARFESITVSAQLPAA